MNIREIDFKVLTAAGVPESVIRTFGYIDEPNFRKFAEFLKNFLPFNYSGSICWPETSFERLQISNTIETFEDLAVDLSKFQEQPFLAIFYTMGVGNAFEEGFYAPTKSIMSTIDLLFACNAGSYVVGADETGKIDLNVLMEFRWPATLTYTKRDFGSWPVCWRT